MKQLRLRLTCELSCPPELLVSHRQGLAVTARQCDVNQIRHLVWMQHELEVL